MFPRRPERTSQAEPVRHRTHRPVVVREVFSRVDLHTPGMRRTISIERGGVFVSTTEGERPAGYYRLTTDVPILLSAIEHARHGSGLRSWPIAGLSIVALPAHTSVGLARLRPDDRRGRTSWFAGAELDALERACTTFLNHEQTRTP